MSFAASRVALRQSRFAVRRSAIRNASTTSEAAGAAKQKAGEAQTKASEGLSRVTSSAGSAVSKAGSAAAGVLNSLANVGGRTGRLVGRIQSMIPPTIYYSKVALEMSKVVIRERKMSPPDVATFQKYFQNAFGQIRSGAIFQQAEKAGEKVGQKPVGTLNAIRNMSSAQWAGVGIVTAEIIGFFSVGEMLGRRKIVGYRAASHEEHH